MMLLQYIIQPYLRRRCEVPNAPLSSGLALSLTLAACLPTTGHAQMWKEDMPSRFCAVAGYSADEHAFQRVQASCQGTGLVLGDAEGFKVFRNTALQATLVELEMNGARRVLLLRPDIAGNPMLEDMTASLAASVGRTPSSGIDDLAVDYTEFATDGTVGVHVVQGPGELEVLRSTTGQDGPSGLAARGGSALNVGEHIASELQRTAAQ